MTKPGEPDSQPEADVAAKLARSARRRWGLPRGLPPNSAFTLPAVGFNIVSIFGSGCLGVALRPGYLPKPYLWIFVTQFGWAWLGIAMMWCFPRRYSIFHGLTGRSYAQLFSAGERRVWLFGVWFPTVFLFGAYYEFVATVHPWTYVLPGCAVGTLLFTAGAAADHELWSDLNRMNLILGFLLCFAYGSAVVLQLNCVLDRSNATVYEATVSAKRNRPHSYDVTVAPWGPEQGPRSLAVPYTLYKSVEPGGRICMVMWRGALRAGWYTAEPCPYSGAPVTLGLGDAR